MNAKEGGEIVSLNGRALELWAWEHPPVLDSYPGLLLAGLSEIGTMNGNCADTKSSVVAEVPGTNFEKAGAWRCLRDVDPGSRFLGRPRHD
jgi:hypothetical protein